LIRRSDHILRLVRTVHTDVNAGGVYSLSWIIRCGAAGVHLTDVALCNPKIVKTPKVKPRVFVCRLSAVRELRGVPGAVSSSWISMSSASSSVSVSVWSDLPQFWYSSLLTLVRRTVCICGWASGSSLGSVYAVVCNVLLLRCFTRYDTRRLVICGGEELRPDECAPWELAHWAGNVGVVWERHDLVRRLHDRDHLSLGTVSCIHWYKLPSRGAGWLSDLPCGCLDIVEYGTGRLAKVTFKRIGIRT